MPRAPVIAARLIHRKDDIKEAKMPVYNSPGNHETRWADMSINRFTDEVGFRDRAALA